MPRPKRKCTTPSAELLAKLAEIRRTREDAENQNSFGPAASLHRLEIDTLALLWERQEIEAREEAEAEAAAESSRDSATVFAGLLDMARELPEELREQLVLALTRQPALRVVKG